MNFEKLEEIAYSLLDKRDSRCFHVAFILKKKRIISIGWNKSSTHPLTKKYNYQPFAKTHAELAAVIRLGEMDCSDFDMAVLRINKNDKIDSSKPCVGCSHMIKQLNFRNVYYTSANGEWLEGV